MLMQMEDEVTAHVEEEVLAVLKRRGPTARAALLAELPHIENTQQLSNSLHSLKRKGEIARNDNGEWALSGTPARARRHTRPRPGAEKNAPRNDRPERRDARAKAKRSAGKGKHTRRNAEPALVRAALEQAHRDAQDALDRYVAAVCDPKILAPLREARDAARRALEACTRTRATVGSAGGQKIR